MMKILFYFNSMTPAGGIERVISTLANKLSVFMDVTILVKDQAYSHYPLRPKVNIVTLDNQLNFDMNNKIKRIFQAGINLIQSTHKLKQFLQHNQFDLIYLAHPLNVLEFHFAQGIDQRVIITEHGAINAYNLHYKQIKHWLYPKARCYVVPTTLEAELYKNLGYPVVYIPHFKSSLPYQKSNLNAKIALSIGRMTEAKRQWILIDLWRDLVKNHQITDWQLYLVGEGNLRKQYQTKIQEYDLTAYIKLLPPLVNVEQYYLNASIFLLTSQSEGFGMVLLEAISFGLPCITYESPPGPQDIIQDGINGYLIPMDNYILFKKATLNLISNHNALQRMSDGAFESSLKWEDYKVMEQWQKILY